MRILIPVDHALGISGPHRNVVGSLNALGARDDVTVSLLTGIVDKNEPYSQAPNIDITLGYKPHEPKRVLHNLRLLQKAQASCDLIYVPSGLKSLLLAQVARRPGRPLVAGPNVTPLPSRRHDSPGWLDLRLLTNAWFEASRARQNHVMRVTGNPNIGVVPHAIDHVKFSPERRNPEIWDDYGIPRHSTKLLYVGKDYERKGVPQLLDAFSILSATHPALVLVVVGNMSPETIDRIRAMPNVFALGFVQGERLAQIYASSDISVVPSSWESFGFTALEAMSSGLAVVAGNGGALPETIINGESGILVDIANEQVKHRDNSGEILAAALVQLVQDLEHRKRLGANARRRVLDHFTEVRLGDDLVHLFAKTRGGIHPSVKSPQ